MLLTIQEITERKWIQSEHEEGQLLSKHRWLSER